MVFDTNLSFWDPFGIRWFFFQGLSVLLVKGCIYIYIYVFRHSKWCLKDESQLGRLLGDFWKLPKHWKVLFDGASQPVPVALRHLRLATAAGVSRWNLQWPGGSRGAGTAQAGDDLSGLG